MIRRDEEAIVLDAETHGEIDRRVLLLTAQGELVCAFAYGAARSRRRFGAALEPGARIRARWSIPNEQAPARLDEALLTTTPPTPDPLERYYTTSHVLEVAARFGREGAEDARAYRLLAAVLARLAAGDPPEALARYFEAWTLRLAGLLPEVDSCDACGADLVGRPLRISGERGAFCPQHAPEAARALGAAASAWLDATREAPPAGLPELPLGAARELEELLPALIVEFTERPLCALPALRRLRR